MSNFLDEKKIKIIENDFRLKLSYEQILAINKWEEIFKSYNSHTNLMSKNEVSNLFEKHFCDSLSIGLWGGFSNKKKLMDIGTGGGFPSVILALCYPELTVFANDSRQKKIKFIELAKENLKLQNLNVLYGRAEEISDINADIITFRAVGKIKDTLPLAKKHAAVSGKAVFYKAKDIESEINEALSAFKNLKTPEIVPYSLPTDIKTTRNLVIFEL